MKKISKIVTPLFLLLFTTLLLVSCDKDFNELGTDFVADDHYGMLNQNFDLDINNKATGAVQTNNLPINTLGFYNDPVFGKTTSSFVTELSLGTTSLDFVNINTIEIDSVYLYVPYFSTLQSTDATTGDSQYTLNKDSILSNSSVENEYTKISLKVYRNNYDLSQVDVSEGLQSLKKHYSDELNDFTNVNQELLYSDDSFEFKRDQIKIKKNIGLSTEAVKERLAPGIFLDLTQNDPAKKAFYKQLLTTGNQYGYLENNNLFRKNLFRGLLFKAAASPSSPEAGTAAKMNFAQGKITIVYKDEKSSTDTTKERKTLLLNLSGNTVNFFDNQNSYTDNVATDELLLKGGNGSISVISLFGGNTNSTSPELNAMRSNKWLINDASITFTVKSPNTLAQVPNRIYLFDLKNKKPIVDYTYDLTTSVLTSKYNKYIHGGIRYKDGDDIKYKIRLTNHLRNLVKYADSTNVKLGLVVTEGIGNTTSMQFKNPTPNYFATGQSLKYLPTMSVANPLGVKLYGTNPSTNNTKKVKFEVWYTKPE